jgi:hypothetical protein
LSPLQFGQLIWINALRSQGTLWLGTEISAMLIITAKVILAVMTIHTLELPMAQIKELCDRHQIIEFALFGSVLRDDFRPNSDIDVLISFAPNARKGLLTLAQIKHELEDLLGRNVDILTKKSIQQSHNPARSRNILNSAQVLYVA